VQCACTYKYNQSIIQLYILGLYKMTIQDNPLPNLNDDSLYGLEHSLWELELINTYLNYVPSRAIRILLKLKVLNLSGMQCNVNKFNTHCDL
jgi:hypothetical protein